MRWGINRQKRSVMLCTTTSGCSVGIESRTAYSNLRSYCGLLLPLGLSLNQNQITRQGLTLIADTLAQSNSTLSICMINNMQDAVDRTMRNRLNGILQHRKRHLRHLTVESNEKRLYLCTLLLEWGVERELVLEICQGQKDSTSTSEAATTSHELRSSERSNQNDHEELVHEVVQTESSPSNQHKIKASPTKAGNQIDHVQTVRSHLEAI